MIVRWVLGHCGVLLVKVVSALENVTSSTNQSMEANPVLHCTNLKKVNQWRYIKMKISNIIGLYRSSHVLYEIAFSTLISLNYNLNFVLV